LAWASRSSRAASGWATHAPWKPSRIRHDPWAGAAEPLATLALTWRFRADPRPRSTPIATLSAVTERTSEPPKLRVGERLRELAGYREILWNLTRKELKVKYTASVLGAVWSLLNPVVFLIVFSFVAAVLGGAVQPYPPFLLAGLLAWNLFNVSALNGAQSVIANANLVKKVYFPREILPLATVGVALVDFVLQSVVFFLYLIVFQGGFQASTVWLYPLAFLDLLLFSVAITMLVSSLNVRYRDVQHLIGLALLVWFWMTPIVYPIGRVYDYLLRSTNSFAGIAWHLYLANPMTWIVNGFQKALFHPADPADDPLAPFTAAQLGLALSIGALILLVFVYLAWRLYFSMSGDFAEEL
jgi:ABC-2 type transport system permease protein